MIEKDYIDLIEELKKLKEQDDKVNQLTQKIVYIPYPVYYPCPCYQPSIYSNYTIC